MGGGQGGLRARMCTVDISKGCGRSLFPPLVVGEGLALPLA